MLAFCQSRQIDETGHVIAKDYLAYTGDISERWRNDHFGEGLDEIRASLSIKNVIPNVSGVIFNRQALLQALEEVGDELFGYRVAGDWLVYLHVLAQGRLYYSAKSLNDHRRHQRSVTSATALENHLAEVAKVQSIAQGIAQPDENVLIQSKEYLARLREQFGLETSLLTGAVMQRTTLHRRAVILGAGGFIGINLANALAEDGCEVICFDRFQCPQLATKGENRLWASLRYAAELLAVLDDATVFHLVSSCRPTSTRKPQQTKSSPMWRPHYVIWNTLAPEISDGFLSLLAVRYMDQTCHAQQRKTHQPTRSAHTGL